MLDEDPYHLLQYDYVLRSVNQPEYGGGELTLPQRIGYQFDADVMVCVDTKQAMQHHNFRAWQIANYAVTTEQGVHPEAILYAIDCATCQLIRKPSTAISDAQDWARLETRNDSKNVGGNSSPWPERETVKDEEGIEKNIQDRQRRDEQRANQDADFGEDSSDEDKYAPNSMGGDSAHRVTVHTCSNCGDKYTEGELVCQNCCKRVHTPGITEEQKGKILFEGFTKTVGNHFQWNSNEKFRGVRTKDAQIRKHA